MSHPSSLIILDRLYKFRFGIHDKWTIARDRFIDGLSAHDQEPALLVGFDAELRAFTVTFD
jgi:hypothetical protein